MKLNKKSIEELRKEVEIRLEAVPEGQRIHIDKEILDSLLFDTFVYDKKNKKVIKLPVWSGKFLRKIDLSEISFEDVTWSTYVPLEVFADVDIDCPIEEIEGEITKNLPRCKRDTITVDYSMSNAKIDFKKSYEFKTAGYFIILNCNFSGVDLSNNDMKYLHYAADCNFSNTKILMPELTETELKHARFYNVDFTNVDLSKYSLPVEHILFYLNDYWLFASCNLTNTGLKLSLNPNDETWNDYFVNRDFSIKVFKEILPKLVGCYINGKKVLSEEEKKIIASKKREEYGLFKDVQFNSILNGIDSQINPKTK